MKFTTRMFSLAIAAAMVVAASLAAKLRHFCREAWSLRKLATVLRL